MRRSAQWLALFILLFFTACEQEESAVYAPHYTKESSFAKKTYLFGVHPLHNPIHLFEIYQPLIAHINASLKDAQLVLEASKTYARFDTKLSQRHFDFMLPNPYQTLQSLNYGYHVFGKMGDDENFRGIILVRKDGAIKKIEDLKGKEISFPAPTALAATIMPQWFLYTQGLDINRDLKSRYVGSQESSIMNVYLGKTAAAGAWIQSWRNFAKMRPDIAQKLKIKWTTESLINIGLVARDDTPPVLTQEIASIIFNLHKHAKGREILNRMQLSRFEAATDDTYKPLKSYLLRFEKHIRHPRQIQ